MGAKLKADKFKSGDTIIGKIRSEVLPNGKIIAFRIAGADLADVFPFGRDIDFDKESDELTVKYRDSKNHLAFEYIPNVGFDEVNIKKTGMVYLRMSHLNMERLYSTCLY